jgi:SAM-dependent methyltransferase
MRSSVVHARACGSACSSSATTRARVHDAFTQVRAAACPNVVYAVVDASDLSRYADASFEVVTMCYGIMFTPDSAACLKEIARVLVPHGRAYLTFWTKLVIMDPLKQVMREVTGEEPPAPPINPLRFAAPDALTALLPEAGLAVEHPAELRYEFDLGADEERAFCGGSIPIAASLASLEAGGAQDVRARAKAAWLRIAQEQGLRAPDGRYVLADNAATLLTLRRT